MASTTIFSEMTALAEQTGAINLGQGFPDEDGPPAVVAAAVRALQDGHNQYAPLAGVPALRAAIAAHQRRHYDIELDPDSGVQVTFGATEGLAATLLALLAPGDEVLVLEPCYDAYPALIALAGARAVPVALEPPGWRLDPDALARAVTPRTRVLLLNSPHNPTGRVLDAGELELLATVCSEHSLLAVTDEVYEHLVYDGAHEPLAARPGMFERTLSVSSLGKSYSLTGWKVGWVGGPPALLARVREVKQFLSFSGGTPLQHAAAAALDSDDFGRLAATLAAKRDRLSRGLGAIGFGVLPSAGTYFLTADAGALGEHDAHALCARLPHEAGVAAIPLSAFASGAPAPASSLLRFAFCKREPVLDEALARLGTWAGR